MVALPLETLSLSSTSDDLIGPPPKAPCNRVMSGGWTLGMAAPSLLSKQEANGADVSVEGVLYRPQSSLALLLQSLQVQPP